MPTFTVEQIRQFLAIADEDDNAAYWRLAVETGMRPSGMIALRWSDLQDGVVHVQRARTYTDKADGYDEHEPKTASSRRQIRLSPTTLKALAAHKAAQSALKLQLGVNYVDSGYVFARWDGRPGATQRLERLRMLLKQASLPPMRLYDLRHVAATLRLLNGERPKVVSEMLGHSSVNITMDIYSHVMPDMQEESAARYEMLMAPAPRTRRVRLAK